MGGKPEKSQLPKQVRKIRAINRRFIKARSKKKPNKKKIAALVDKKDRLINEMCEECPCEELWIGEPDTSNPLRMNGHKYVVACKRCASSSFLDEEQGEMVAAGQITVSEEVVPRLEFDILVGKLIRKLGINI